MSNCTKAGRSPEARVTNLLREQIEYAVERHTDQHHAENDHEAQADAGQRDRADPLAANCLVDNADRQNKRHKHPQPGGAGNRNRLQEQLSEHQPAPFTGGGRAAAIAPREPSDRAMASMMTSRFSSPA